MGRFWIDTNSVNKPNRYGKDQFAFVIVNGKGILTAGYGNNSLDCTRNLRGVTCAAKVLKDGDINY